HFDLAGDRRAHIDQARIDGRRELHVGAGCLLLRRRGANPGLLHRDLGVDGLGNCRQKRGKDDSHHGISCSESACRGCAGGSKRRILCEPGATRAINMPNTAVSARPVDAWGLPLTAASAEAAAAYDATIAAYLAFSRDTGAKLKALFAADPQM